MKNLWCVVSLGILAVTARGGTAPPTFEFKVVAVNGNPITPTNAATVQAGDMVELNVFGSNWSPAGEKLQAWQCAVLEESLASGGGSPLKIVGWPDTCNTPTGECDGAFIDETRTDYVYFNQVEFKAVDSSTQSVRWASVLLNAFPAPVYSGTPKYFATLLLEVPADSCGDFVIEFKPSQTQFIDEDGLDIADRVTPTHISATITVGGACPCNLVTDSTTGELVSTPPNCAIDARQPNDVDGSNPAGWDTVTFTAAPGGDCTGLTASDFTLSEVPPDLSLGRNRVTGVTVNGDTITVQFRDMITVGSWTCVRYLGSGGGRVCFGHLPADVGNEGLSSADDVMTMLDCLANPGSCEMYQCDTDRSGGCGAADILRTIDLLNGAGSLGMWMGEVIGNGAACPSAP